MATVVVQMATQRFAAAGDMALPQLIQPVEQQHKAQIFGPQKTAHRWIAQLPIAMPIEGATQRRDEVGFAAVIGQPHKKRSYIGCFSPLFKPL